jgi:hypothetical protein
MLSGNLLFKSTRKPRKDKKNAPQPELEVYVEKVPKEIQNEQTPQLHHEIIPLPPSDSADTDPPPIPTLQPQQPRVPDPVVDLPPKKFEGRIGIISFRFVSFLVFLFSLFFFFFRISLFLGFSDSLWTPGFKPPQSSSTQTPLQQPRVPPPQPKPLPDSQQNTPPPTSPKISRPQPQPISPPTPFIVRVQPQPITPPTPPTPSTTRVQPQPITPPTTRVEPQPITPSTTRAQPQPITPPTTRVQSQQPLVQAVVKVMYNKKPVSGTREKRTGQVARIFEKVVKKIPGEFALVTESGDVLEGDSTATFDQFLKV